jgi:uncharacterized protein (UPF0332 family)
MTLRHWAEKGWIRPHRASREEIGKLFAIVERDLRDAKAEVTADWRFGIAYNAALKLCTILLHSEGFRTGHGRHHYRTIQAMPLILGKSKRPEADYLNVCRIKRNSAEYEYTGAVTDQDVQELIGFVEVFFQEIEAWLREKHPDLF